MAVPGSRSRAGRALLAALAVTAFAAGCSESGEEKREAFCDDARELGELTDPLRNVSGASTPEDLEALVTGSRADFESLAEDAPDDIADDFGLLAEGIAAYEELLAGAAWDASAVDEAARAEIDERYRGASDAVNTWLKRCDVDTGAGGPATTTTTTTG